MSCPVLIVGRTSTPSKAKKFYFIDNGSDESVKVTWVEFNGRESSWIERLEPGERSEKINTYEGHLWRVWSLNDGALIREIKVRRSTPDTIKITNCRRHNEGTAQKAESKKPAKLEIYSQFSPENVKTTVPISAAESLFPGCSPSAELGADTVSGFWVLCGRGTVSNDMQQMQVGAWQKRNSQGVVFDIPPTALSSAAGIRYCLRKALRLKEEPTEHGDPSLPDFVLWDSAGIHQVHLAADMIASNRMFLFEGGNFIWPGVDIGHIRHVPKSGSEGGSITFKTISLRPLVFEIENFLKPEECDHIIDLAKPHMGASIVNRMDGDEGKSAATWRTSTTHFLSRGETPLTKQIERRIFDATRIPITHGEGTQVLRYEKTQHYYTHHDFFEPNRYRNSRSTLKMIENGAKNRLATVFWYMSDVEEGGQTNFPRSGGLPAPTNNKECTQGLLVEARRGKVIVFFNMLPSGELDHLSLHAGCSVKKGVKWAANKWLWNKPTSGSWDGDDEDKDLLRKAENIPEITLTENQIIALLEEEKTSFPYGSTRKSNLSDHTMHVALWQLLGIMLFGAIMYFLVCHRRKPVKKVAHKS